MEAKFFVFFSCLIVLCAGYSAPPPKQCGSNEQLSCVYECPPERTCRTRNVQFRCMAPTKECEEKCICKPDFFRNPIGECISNKRCDQCDDNLNLFFTCGPVCDNECSTLATQNRTNCPILNIQCNEKCYCKDGFARDSENNCVPIEKCPNPNSCKCTGINEKYVDCKQTCPPEFCSSIVSRFDCSKEPPCKPGCACKSGFFRQNKDSPCLHVCKCSEMNGTLQCAKECY